MTTYNKLFQPIKIGNMEVKNRFVMPPMVTNYCNTDGSVTDQFVAYHKARAKGGVGLIITEAAIVHPSGRGAFTQLGIFNDELIPSLKRLTSVVHEEGAKIAIQLYHAGRQTYTFVTGMPALLAPSALACPVCAETPQEMTKNDIREIVAAFGKASVRAREAGFDAIELHGAHGYLINQFLSPFSNRRTDEYGGAAENRWRFPLELLKSVQQHAGSDFPVLFRLSADEFVQGGLSVEDQAAFSCRLIENGVHAIHVSGGIYASMPMVFQPAAIPQGIFVNNAAIIRKALNGKAPVIVVGRLKDPDMMEAIIDSGKADMIAIGRTLLADEAFPAKVAAGKLSEIRKCIACNQGCVDQVFQGRPIGCLGNALTGREWQYDLDTKAKKTKKVLIAGGGPGGMEAARIASLRGHDVHLYEQGNSLGGLLKTVILAPFKEEFGDLLNYQIHQLEKSNITIQLGQTAQGTVIDQLNPDVVMIATGARPVRPNIPGLDRLPVVFAEEILAGAPLGENVVIIGGGAVGCETAEFLLNRGVKVTVVEICDEIARDVGAIERTLLIQRLMEKGVKLATKTSVKEVSAEGHLALEHDQTSESINDIDTIILAVGYESVTGLMQTAADRKVPFVTIGDCNKPGKVLDAIWEGFMKAFEL